MLHAKETIRDNLLDDIYVSMPANRRDLVIQRILVRHGVSRDLAGLLLDDMKRTIDFFEKHPVHATMTAEEAGGFKH